MQDVFFYLFAGAALLCGLLVVANPFSRSPVTSAMFLVLTIMAQAALFVLLHAFFLAAIQILVYAGAVMVLFLFVVMLLDLKEEQRRRVGRFTLFSGVLVVGGIAAVLIGAVFRTRLARDTPPSIEAHAADLGRALFTDYLLPFEMLSVLLLTAMVGVVLLSKKELK